MNATTRLVKEYAREVGFDLVGISLPEPFSDHREITLTRMREGLMDGLPWFTESRVRRGCDPEELLPGARSIISVGLSYYDPNNGDSGPLDGRIARYAWGDDYHKLMKKRLRRYVEGLAERLDRVVWARWYVDDGPMLDRAAAHRAGIGWFGKNTNILSSSHGSWVFLGQAITDLELEPDTPLKKTCGSCVRCIEDCPTGAIIAPYVIDNTRCISYLTIENRGSIPRSLRPLMNDWIFGCDICQDVCPVNSKAMYSQEQAFKKKRFTSLELVRLLDMTDEEFRLRFRNSPVKRAKLAGLKRNACVALGNSGDRTAVPALVQALSYGEPLVKGHAAWALGRLGGSRACEALRDSLGDEVDVDVCKEITMALEEARISSI